jgi:hypothetical protein
VSFAVITFCVASQRVFIVIYFVMTQPRNFWIHPCMSDSCQRNLKVMFVVILVICRIHEQETFNTKYLDVCINYRYIKYHNLFEIIAFKC